MPRLQTTEDRRLEEARTRKNHWKRWGPYLSERQWGTVREDYSANGTAWEFLPHDHARSRAYRWGEDGIAGFSDRHQYVCFGLAMWNGRDPILKERMFGLTGNQGNHGEDVKECYFYLDSTPTHSYMRTLYKYPHAEYPYQYLIDENNRRNRKDPEFELVDTGVFSEHRYFDVFAEYAKADVEDILIKITVANRGPESATLHLLPSLWFRNTWSWGRDPRRPIVRKANNVPGGLCCEVQHWQYGKRWLLCEGQPDLLFTENETNNQRLFNSANASPYVKDAFHEYLIRENKAAVNPALTGTKMAAHYAISLGAGESKTVKLRLTDLSPLAELSAAPGGSGSITSPGHVDRDEGHSGGQRFCRGLRRRFCRAKKKRRTSFSPRAFPSSFPKTPKT